MGFIGVNGWWQDNHGKGNIKGRVNGFQVLDALAMLGTVLLNFFHGKREFS